ncbi:DUF3426 domain-containing protein [Marinomonas transparens]|uniref:Zinc-ribbon domain-containing protein n=1 Tax=Marinomonas transparens TaxID=2795388 RepID=A0A934JXQ9_9GAMM|nr:DUF3426 domain-containing protein [Marinomonas transparens]MBJ7539134.1 zinc-ribbon domain-containing protein [Marinomonas transparens]
MANSLITRCPKCSTAFRVSDEALSMAKGKVRCGQCFHIFDAQKAINEKQAKNNEKQTQATTREEATPASESAKKTNKTDSNAQFDTRLAPVSQDDINPEWLHTLFKDDDLTSPGQTKSQDDAQVTPSQENRKIEEPAPWEVELAEVEAALNSTSSPLPIHKEAKTAPTAYRTPKKAPEPEPDYMVALHSLAQSASEQARPSNRESQHTILEQLSAQDNLAPLLDENKTSKQHPLRWLWTLGTLLGLIVLASQVAEHFFDQGSRSTNFRAIYRTICTYSGCNLPRFEDVSAISIQNVRVQSHPSIPNTLLVNAIITNTTPFSQPMPKIALEFFDLNGAPVAARLFAPSSYLHKDFLDITYMPPNTPIHLVIPIQDPGARAVTHQLRAFPTDTRSY